jgi:hypothetical protein
MILSVWNTGDIGFMIFIILLYFLPSILSWNKKNFGQVFVINFFLGWSFIGYVIALAMSLKKY